MSNEQLRNEMFKDTPDGRYAACLNEDDFRFFRFKTLSKGYDKGNRLIQLQASDAWLKVGTVSVDNDQIQYTYRLKQVEDHFETVLANHLEAALLYSDKLGECCRCGRTLTDERSRALGIGPECVKHWPELEALGLTRHPELQLESSQPQHAALQFPAAGVSLNPSGLFRKKLI